MDYPEGVPVVDPTDAANLHPLELFQQLQQASMGKAPSMPAVPNAPAPPPGDGMRGLLQMLAPVLGGLAMGGGVKQTGFMNGYAEGQKIVDEDKKQKAEEAAKRSGIAATYLQKISDQAEQITDPVQFAHFVDTADMGFAKSGLGKPGEIKNQVSFNASGKSAKQLKEVVDNLHALQAAYPDLDQIKGATIKLSDGTFFPVALAMQLDQNAPFVNGKPVARPIKAAATEEERYIAKWAKENGVNIADMTTDQVDTARQKFKGDKPAGTIDERAAALLGEIATATGKGDTATATAKKAEYARIVQAKKDLAGASTDPRLTDINLSLKQLQLENELNKAKQAAGGPFVIPPGSGYEKMAAQLASGDLTFAQMNRTLTTRGSGGQNINAVKMALYEKATELNPEFSPAKFEMGYKFATNQGTQMASVALNRVEPNIDKLIALSDKWDRTKYPTINSFLRAVGVQWGDQRITDFGQLQTIVGDELGPALGVGSATDLKTRLGLEMAGGNKGADSFKSGMLLVKEALNNQRKALNQQKGAYGDKTPADSGGDATSALSILEARRKKQGVK